MHHANDEWGARLHADGQRHALLQSRGGKGMRRQLVHEVVLCADVNESGDEIAGEDLQQLGGVVMLPRLPVRPEVPRQGLLSPRDYHGIANRRKGRQRLILAWILHILHTNTFFSRDNLSLLYPKNFKHAWNLEENRQCTMAAHGVPHDARLMGALSAQSFAPTLTKNFQNHTNQSDTLDVSRPGSAAITPGSSCQRDRGRVNGVCKVQRGCGDKLANSVCTYTSVMYSYIRQFFHFSTVAFR